MPIMPPSSHSNASLVQGTPTATNGIHSYSFNPAIEPLLSKFRMAGKILLEYIKPVPDKRGKELKICINSHYSKLINWNLKYMLILF